MTHSGPSLRVFGESGVLPLRSPCPAGCKFCYETHLPKLVPNVKLVKNPAYDSSSFDEFKQGLATACAPATPVSPVWVDEGVLHYSSMSDIFCQGLSNDQIEELVRHNVGKERRELATTGNHLDPDFIAYLTQKYPETFRLHYSVVTLEPAYRARVFTHVAPASAIRRTLEVLREAKIYLCNLEPKQTIADLLELNACVAPGTRVQIARMHCTRMHPEDVRDLARGSSHGWDELASWIATHRDRLDHLSEIGFQAPPEAYAYTFRDEVARELLRFDPRAGDVVVSSPSAAKVLAAHAVPPGVTVLPVFDSLGASTCFTTTLSTANIIDALRPLAEASALSRVLVPASTYWVQDRYSIDGRSPEDVAAAFPGVKVEVVPVAHEVRRARLSLEQLIQAFAAMPEAIGRGDYRTY